MTHAVGNEAEREARLRFAIDIARAAGELTLQHFRSPDLAVERKGDDSPVTVADRAAERLLRERIADAYPQDGVVGEEEDDTAGESGFTWIVDPIDGTEAFHRGVPLYGNLVACEAEGEVQVGVINCPAAGEYVAAARGLGTRWVVGDEAPRVGRVSKTARLADSVLSTTSLFSCARTLPPSFYASLPANVGHDRGWSDCYAYVLVATGRIEVALDALMHVWDNAPLQVVVEEAGGRFSDLAGERTFRGTSALATNGLVHDELLALLRANDAG
ncbi:MAG: inositol monophosphatase family protein [Planctomycetota bacterium]